MGFNSGFKGLTRWKG